MLVIDFDYDRLPVLPCDLLMNKPLIGSVRMLCESVRKVSKVLDRAIVKIILNKDRLRKSTRVLQHHTLE